MNSLGSAAPEGTTHSSAGLPSAAQGQKPVDGIAFYFARRVSRHLTPMFLRAGLSANQTTAVWGVLGAVNSFAVYLCLTGHYLFVPVVFLVHFLVETLDCVDGEVARIRKTASPIGGKLLDGLWHKVTEFSLLLAYVSAAYSRTASPAVLFLGMLLVAGEALYTYVYERRLLVIRVFAKSDMRPTKTTSDDLYSHGEKWADFSLRRRVNVLKGLIPGKSTLLMIALSAISAELLIAGLVCLTAYRHFAWLRLLVDTVYHPPPLSGA